MANELQNKHIDVIIGNLNEKITRLQRQIVELEESKQALLGQYGYNGNHSSSNHKQHKQPRLGIGVPQKWVEEAMGSEAFMSISMIMNYIENKKGRKLRDATIRRALNKLMDEGKVKRNEDGSWSLANSSPLDQLMKSGEDDS